jgi:hypothetical protein
MKVMKRGKHLDTPEKYHIHKISKNELLMSIAYVDVYNLAYEMLQEVNTRQQHKHAKTEKINAA